MRFVQFLFFRHALGRGVGIFANNSGQISITSLSFRNSTTFGLRLFPPLYLQFFPMIHELTNTFIDKHLTIYPNYIIQRITSQ